MTTDTSEKGLEELIVAAMAGRATHDAGPEGSREPLEPYGGTGWLLGNWRDYDRDYCVDLVQLQTFVEATQLKIAESRSTATISW